MAVAFLLFSMAVDAQELSGEVTVDGDRPLYMAAQQVAEQTKTLITFEELVFEYPGDFTEWTDRNGKTRVIPKYGKFDFEYEAETPVDEVLQAMLGKYNSEYPGNYMVVGGDSAFHIIPDSSKDTSGNFIPRKSLLDTRVTLNFASNNAHDMICDIVQQVSVANNVELSCVTDLARLSSVTIDNFSTTNQVARDVLVDILKQAGGERSWVIFHSTAAQQYAISFIGQPNQ